jgi:ATP-dependent helicase/nuclease subunit B
LQPFTVERTEEKIIHQVSGLQLNLRIDRIDRLENGRLVLIDYKSGETKAGDLESERPKEPQLLLYASALGDEVDGMFFGQLKARDQRLVGYSRQAHSGDSKNKKAKVCAGWYDFLHDRRSAVEHLAAGFVAGDAVVGPQKGACEYCGCAPFCRVNEAPQESEECE